MNTEMNFIPDLEGGASGSSTPVKYRPNQNHKKLLECATTRGERQVKTASDDEFEEENENEPLLSPSRDVLDEIEGIAMDQQEPITVSDQAELPFLTPSHRRSRFLRALYSNKLSKTFLWILITVIACFCILTMIAVAFGLPMYAHYLVNTSRFEIKQLYCQRIENNSIEMVLDLEIHGIPKSTYYDVINDPMDIYIVTGYNSGDDDKSHQFELKRNIAKFTLPSIKLSQNVQFHFSGLNLEILDQNLFSFMMQDLLLEKMVWWNIESKMNLNILGPFGLGHKLSKLPLNKRVPLVGFDEFSQHTLKAFEISYDHDKATVIMYSVVEYMNNSPISIDIGKVMFNLFYSQVAIGELTAETLPLNSGLNEWRLNGTLFKPSSPDADQSILSDLLTGFIKGIETHLLIQGECEKGKEVLWLNKAFRDLAIPIILPGIPNLKPVQSIEMNEIGLDFRTISTAQNAKMPLFMSFTAKYLLPIQIPIGFKSSSMKLNFLNEDHITMSTIECMDQNISSGDLANQILTFKDFKCINTIVHEGLFQSFVKDIVHNHETTIHFDALINFNLSTPLSDLHISALPITQRLSLNGLNGLQDLQPTIESISIFNATDTHLFMKVDVSVSDPVELTAQLGDINLDLFVNSTNLGFISLIDFNMKSKSSSSQTALISMNSIDDSNRDVYDQFFSSYVNHIPINATLKGNDHSTVISILQPALQSVELTVTIPPLSNTINFINELILYQEYLKPSLKLSLYNPFDIECYIYGIYDVLIYYIDTANDNEVPFATMDEPNLKEPICLPPNSNSITKLSFSAKPLNGTQKTLWKLLKDLLWKSGHYSFITIHGKLNVSLDKYDLGTIDYIQRNVTLRTSLFMNEWMNSNSLL